MYRPYVSDDFKNWIFSHMFEISQSIVSHKEGANTKDWEGWDEAKKLILLHFKKCAYNIFAIFLGFTLWHFLYKKK